MSLTLLGTRMKSADHVPSSDLVGFNLHDYRKERLFGRTIPGRECIGECQSCRFDDFEIIDYECHPAIRAPVAV